MAQPEIFDRVIQFRENGSTNAFLDLDTGDLMTPPPDIARAIEARKGQPLLTWGGSNDERQFVDWVRREGVDMWLHGPKGLRVAGGEFVGPSENPAGTQVRFRLWPETKGERH
jgi:hypothetical protein